MTTNSQSTKTTVSLGESRYGSPQPQIEIRMARGTSPRILNATLHKLAAEIELATPAREQWVVIIEDCIVGGRVYLELDKATTAEAERAMAMLKTLMA